MKLIPPLLLGPVSGCSRHVVLSYGASQAACLEARFDTGIGVAIRHHSSTTTMTIGERVQPMMPTRSRSSSPMHISSRWSESIRSAMAALHPEVILIRLTRP